MRVKIYRLVRFIASKIFQVWFPETEATMRKAEGSAKGLAISLNYDTRTLGTTNCEYAIADEALEMYEDIHSHSLTDG